MQLRIWQSTLIISLVALVSVVQAELLVYEPFDYTTGMHDAAGTSEIGFDAAAWDATVSSVDATAVGTSANLGFGTGQFVLRSGGNAGRFSVSNDASSTGSAKWLRGLNASLGASNDLWLSYLVKTYGNITNTAGRSINTLIEGTGRQIEFLPKLNNSASAQIRFNGGPASAVIGGRLTDTDTYLVIAKYGLNTSNTTGSVDAWVLTEGQFNGVASDGAISEAELNASNPHAEGANSGTLAGDALLDLTDRYSFLFTPNAASAKIDVGYDELRLADSLADAVPIIPWTERISDTFNDDSHLYNKNGTGLGFAEISNTAVIGSGTRSESGGTLTVTTTGNTDNSGVGSKVSLGAGPEDRAVVTWDIASVSNRTTHGLELMIQSGSGFRAGPFFQIKFNGAGEGLIVANGGTATTLHGPFGVSGVADGFTAELTADAERWSVKLTGATIGGETVFTGTTYGTTSFADIFADGIVAITVQGATPAAVLVINEITASIASKGTVFLVL